MIDLLDFLPLAAILAATGVIAGILAGLLGVGGGMILGPIFNELEFLPQVSSATSTNHRSGW